METLLNDEEWRGWSDREIAKRAGVSHNFVSTLRPICHPMTDAPTPARTVERNGVTYQQNTANIGRKALQISA
ncbi:MAG: hypothetical protein JNL79_29260 [Myxococcales bacterium]|nr:hypothetical protein [Myxococcales bacterium]